MCFSECENLSNCLIAKKPYHNNPCVYLTKLNLQHRFRHSLQSLIRHDYFLFHDDAICDALAQLLWTVLVVVVKRSVEEVAHILDNGTSFFQLFRATIAFAIELGWEYTGFNQLRRVRKWVILGREMGGRVYTYI